MMIDLMMMMHCQKLRLMKAASQLSVPILLLQQHRITSKVLRVSTAYAAMSACGVASIAKAATVSCVHMRVVLHRDSVPVLFWYDRV